MPRKGRIDATGAVHHVVVRGIERSPIFRDSKDLENFLSRLSVLLKETSTSCYAWALIKNHVHLLLRSGRVGLSPLMRRLLTGYAQQFNRRHKRSGHLFQNRYKSFLCEEDPYLMELVRYIHLNPIRAGLVHDMAGLENFRWCGGKRWGSALTVDTWEARWGLAITHFRKARGTPAITRQPPFPFSPSGKIFSRARGVASAPVGSRFYATCTTASFPCANGNKAATL